jgi:hypothetical protein
LGKVNVVVYYPQQEEPDAAPIARSLWAKVAMTLKLQVSVAKRLFAARPKRYRNLELAQH